MNFSKKVFSFSNSFWLLLFNNCWLRAKFPSFLSIHTPRTNSSEFRNYIFSRNIRLITLTQVCVWKQTFKISDFYSDSKLLLMVSDKSYQQILNNLSIKAIHSSENKMFKWSGAKQKTIKECNSVALTFHLTLTMFHCTIVTRMVDVGKEVKKKWWGGNTTHNWGG